MVEGLLDYFAAYLVNFLCISTFLCDTYIVYLLEGSIWNGRQYMEKSRTRSRSTCPFISTTFLLLVLSGLFAGDVASLVPRLQKFRLLPAYSMAQASLEFQKLLVVSAVLVFTRVQSSYRAYQRYGNVYLLVGHKFSKWFNSPAIEHFRPWTAYKQLLIVQAAWLERLPAGGAEYSSLPGQRRLYVR